MSDIRNLEDALEMIGSVGKLVGRPQEAIELVEQISSAFKCLEVSVNNKKNGASVAYLIWDKPLMCAGAGTFIDDMLRRCGLQNVFESAEGRYPVLTREELEEKNPDLILLSSEPFPFNEKHAGIWRQRLKHTEVKCVDGEYFSWYGSRLKKAPDYFLEFSGFPLHGPRK